LPAGGVTPAGLVDGVTFSQSHSQAQVEEILLSVPLELAAFDAVGRATAVTRLVVVAEKPA